MAKRIGRKRAEILAKSGITWGQIQTMLTRAQEGGAVDARQATVNTGMTKAQCFDILGYAFEYDPGCVVDNRDYSMWVCARHCLVEFGEFWA